MSLYVCVLLIIIYSARTLSELVLDNETHCMSTVLCLCVYMIIVCEMNIVLTAAVVLLAGLLGLAVLALLYVFMALTHRNFKKGLKEKGGPI